MTNLIAQLESAPEGSRGLDYMIHTKLGWIDQDQGGWDGPNGEHTGEGWPHYTTNLQDAVEALPEGWFWIAGNSAINGVSAEIWETREQATCSAWAKAPTPALALCIAAIRALKSEGV